MSKPDSTPDAPAPGTTALEAPVTRVTLMEDRAQVERAGTADLPAGRSVLTVSGLAPVLADKTLSARIETGDARIAHLNVRRDFRDLVAEDPGEQDRIKTERDEARDRAQRIEADLQRARKRLRLLSQIHTKSLTEFTDDVSWNRAEPDAWQKALEDLEGRERQAQEQSIGLFHDLKKHQQSVADLDRLLETLSHPGTEMIAMAELVVDVRTAGPVALNLSYIVPGACWRPQHTLTVTGGEDGATAHFETDATVWQFSGEDWLDAELVFSTERPSLGTEPPLLSQDTLSTRPKQEQVEVEMRDQQIETTGLGGPSGRKAPTLPGIDDGGEDLALRGRDRARIPSDGRPYRVPLFGFEATVELDRICFPELSEAVVRRARMENGADHPLLAGPVDLVSEAGFTGRTSMLFVAPGERFEIGLGPDPAVRVRRNPRKGPERKGMLSRYVRSEREVEIKLSNLSPEPVTFQLTERVPVSEVEQVRIEFDEKGTTPPARPDDKGFVAWDVSLIGGGTKRCVLRYVVEKHKDVQGI